MSMQSTLITYNEYSHAPHVNRYDRDRMICLDILIYSLVGPACQGFYCSDHQMAPLARRVRHSLGRTERDRAILSITGAL